MWESKDSLAFFKPIKASDDKATLVLEVRNFGRSYRKVQLSQYTMT